MQVCWLILCWADYCPPYYKHFCLLNAFQINPTVRRLHLDMSGKGSVLPPGVGPYQCGECELNVKKSQRTSAMVVQHWVRHHSVGQGSEPGNIRFRDISTGQLLFAR